MSMIINASNNAYERQSHRRYLENWNGDGWIPVPPELEAKAVEYCPYCELVIKDGALVDIVPTERPPEPEPVVEPTETERLRADIDFLAAMTGVQL